MVPFFNSKNNTKVFYMITDFTEIKGEKYYYDPKRNIWVNGNPGIMTISVDKDSAKTHIYIGNHPVDQHNYNFIGKDITDGDIGFGLDCLYMAIQHIQNKQHIEIECCVALVPNFYKVGTLIKHPQIITDAKTTILNPETKCAILVRIPHFIWHYAFCYDNIPIPQRAELNAKCCGWRACEYTYYNFSNFWPNGQRRHYLSQHAALLRQSQKTK